MIRTRTRYFRHAYPHTRDSIMRVISADHKDVDVVLLSVLLCMLRWL
jgi:hypothetical protein